MRDKERLLRERAENVAAFTLVKIGEVGPRFHVPSPHLRLTNVGKAEAARVDLRASWTDATPWNADRPRFPRRMAQGEHVDLTTPPTRTFDGVDEFGGRTGARDAPDPHLVLSWRDERGSHTQRVDLP